MIRPSGALSGNNPPGCGLDNTPTTRGSYPGSRSTSIWMILLPILTSQTVRAKKLIHTLSRFEYHALPTSSWAPRISDPMPPAAPPEPSTNPQIMASVLALSGVLIQLGDRFPGWYVELMLFAMIPSR